ncbi:hypothetical protein LTR17_002298 [Elasticomyces elasticus]|nr:hypothetical protein LTR17_002298 [Elasticomyces elasticus]
MSYRRHHPAAHRTRQVRYATGILLPGIFEPADAIALASQIIQFNDSTPPKRRNSALVTRYLNLQETGLSLLFSSLVSPTPYPKSSMLLANYDTVPFGLDQGESKRNLKDVTTLTPLQCSIIFLKLVGTPLSLLMCAGTVSLVLHYLQLTRTPFHQQFGHHSQALERSVHLLISHIISSHNRHLFDRELFAFITALAWLIIRPHAPDELPEHSQYTRAQTAA